MVPRTTVDGSRGDEPDVLITQEDLARFLKRGFLWAALAAVAIAVAVYLYRSASPYVYESTAIVYAADNVVDLRSIGLSYLVSPSLHVTAYEVAARSDEVLTDSLTRLGVPEPTDGAIDELRSAIEVTSNEESRLITLQARAMEPREAARTAQAVAESLVSWDSQRPRENLMRMIDGLRERIDSLDEQLSTLPAGPQHDSLSALRAEQLSQLATAVMLSDSVVGRLEIVQPAAVSDGPVAPAPVFEAVVAALVVFLLAYLVQLLLSLFDGRLRDPALVPALTGLPLLALFPSQRRWNSRRWVAGAEGYLRSALMPGTSRPITILFAPVGRPEQSSSLALTMAESFARSGAATLLVSTVSRDPLLVERSGFKHRLDNTLEAHLRNPDGEVKTFHLKVDGPGLLAVVPSWEQKADLSELLTFGLRKSLQRWRQGYEVVILVTPPILEAPDAVTAAPLVNRTVLVTDRSVRRSDLVTAVGLLGQRNVVPVGVVMTGVRPAANATRALLPTGKLLGLRSLSASPQASTTD